MILITGASGNSGGELLRLFKTSDHEIRCMVRRDVARQQLEAQGWATVLGDFDDRPSLDRALDGVQRAYLVCTPDENLKKRETRFIDAAREAGVDRLVLLSGFPCESADSPILAAHAAVESHLQTSGLDFTVLRPLGFMQTIFWMSLPTIQEDGVMFGSTGDGKNAVIDLRDVAAVAHKALVEDEHSKATYDLTGPEALSMGEMAQLLGRHLAVELRYVDLPPEQFAHGMRQAGVPQIAIAHILEIFGAIRAGHLDTELDTLAQLGVQARTFDEFARDISTQTTTAATSFSPPAGK